MPKMNSELKAKWVAALRDPRRKQGNGWLRTEDGMCCLGVLCDVIDPSQWESCDPKTAWLWGEGPGSSVLPAASVNALVGFDPASEDLFINGVSARPQQHNDMHCATFLQIADAIEGQW